MSLIYLHPTNAQSLSAAACSGCVVLRHTLGHFINMTNVQPQFRWRAGNLVYKQWSRSFTGANDNKKPIIVSPQLQLDAHASGHQEPHTTLRF